MRQRSSDLLEGTSGRKQSRLVENRAYVLEDAASRMWRNSAALTVFPSAFFAAAYIRFMRMDIR